MPSYELYTKVPLLGGGAEDKLAQVEISFPHIIHISKLVQEAKSRKIVILDVGGERWHLGSSH